MSNFTDNAACLFSCSICNFKGKDKHDYKRHLQTNKHILKATPISIPYEDEEKNYYENN